MTAHRSVRAFLPDVVPDEVIQRCVVAAQQAPASSWVQAYCLLQVTEPSRRKPLVELTGGQAQVAEAGVFFVVCADARRHQFIAERGVEGRTWTGGLWRKYVKPLREHLCAYYESKSVRFE